MMKNAVSIVALTVALVSLTFCGAAHADQYLNCEMIGESGPHLFAPQKVRLEEASGKWFLREDGKNVRDIEVRSTRKGISVGHTALKQGKAIQFDYVFDDSACDEEGTGSATLTKTVIGETGIEDAAPAPGSSTSVYDCRCAID
jgi:hypothetical protein